MCSESARTAAVLCIQHFTEGTLWLPQFASDELARVQTALAVTVWSKIMLAVFESWNRCPLSCRTDISTCSTRRPSPSL